jgi:hypothetical protein
VEFALAVESAPWWWSHAGSRRAELPTKYHGAHVAGRLRASRTSVGFDASSVEVHGAISPTTCDREVDPDIYKTGRSGTMLFIVHRMEFSNQRGEPVSVVDWRMVQQDRGAK